jgi:beta-glucanase (GH16 family)
MEHINSETRIHGTMHWFNTAYAKHGTRFNVGTPASYHTYAVDWTPTALTWSVDGTTYLTGNITNGINGTEEFHRPFFLLLNLAVGGNWPGAPRKNTPFPSSYLVDYVRVSQ